jgi:Mlc titration factor MtfA (ptsG expression regulator)
VRSEKSPASHQSGLEILKDNKEKDSTKAGRVRERKQPWSSILEHIPLIVVLAMDKANRMATNRSQKVADYLYPCFNLRLASWVKNYLDAFA